MNAPWHDEFVALCALYPSGELTEEEWALLQVHLAYCDSCRILFREYEQIGAQVIPAMASASAEFPDESTESIRAAEERLMSALQEQPATEKREAKPSWYKISAPLAIAAGVLGVGWLGFHLVSNRILSPPITSVSVEQPKVLAPPSAAGSRSLEPELQAAHKEIEDLRAGLGKAESQNNQTMSRIVSLSQQLDSAEKEREKISSEREEINQQLLLTRQQMQDAQQKETSSAKESKQNLLRIAALESRVRDLSGNLEEKDRNLSLDRELLAHDRDIRELIAARDLYIADILDVSQNGKTAKPFGRIFYTKDRSLIFYGYDLDKQPGLKQAVAFQAWGSGDQHDDVSLGLFYQDDSKKRWVLRFNDTKTLAHLNKVFVTAEPAGGSAKPTGKPLLMAYLQMKANHP